MQRAGWKAGGEAKVAVVTCTRLVNPERRFQKRIGFCLDLHNESVKAMRYPLNTRRKDVATTTEAREREKELVKEIKSGEHDDDDVEPDF